MTCRVEFVNDTDGSFALITADVFEQVHIKTILKLKTAAKQNEVQFCLFKLSVQLLSTQMHED